MGTTMADNSRKAAITPIGGQMGAVSASATGIAAAKAKSIAAKTAVVVAKNASKKK